jgi:hypothetical protein
LAGICTCGHRTGDGRDFIFGEDAKNWSIR